MLFIYLEISNCRFGVVVQRLLIILLGQYRYKILISFLLAPICMVKSEISFEHFLSPFIKIEPNLQVIVKFN
jgi:hypothetical protein